MKRYDLNLGTYFVHVFDAFLWSETQFGYNTPASPFRNKKRRLFRRRIFDPMPLFTSIESVQKALGYEMSVDVYTPHSIASSICDDSSLW